MQKIMEETGLRPSGDYDDENYSEDEGLEG